MIIRMLNVIKFLSCITISKRSLIFIIIVEIFVKYKLYLLTINYVIEQKSDLFRERVQCNFCQNISYVEKISEISNIDFENFYAYNGKPLVVQNVTKHWRAYSEFNFSFFQKLFADFRNRSDDTFNCQFFPYKTKFKSIFEAFEVNDLTNNFELWYIGWANCYRSIENYLKEFYQRPTFLPLYSEDTKLSWIFMGNPGHGAHLHIDNVIYNSWQAQIKGRKKWVLVPPPECYFHCNRLELIVDEGDIFIVDTNRWYHQTIVLNNGISITIGSEFD